jgi:hypothetical protein
VAENEKQDAPKEEAPKKRTPRQEMEAAHARGESVLYADPNSPGVRRIIPPGQPLPDEAELAQGDATREAAARNAIDDQIAALTRQRDKLTTAPSAPADTAQGKGTKS